MGFVALIELTLISGRFDLFEDFVILSLGRTTALLNSSSTPLNFGFNSCSRLFDSFKISEIAKRDNLLFANFEIGSSDAFLVGLVDLVPGESGNAHQP